PEAVINMLALLGWNPGTEQEIFSLDELIKIFDLSKVNKSGAKFDPEKTKWFQHQYFVKQDDAIVTKEFQKILEVKNIRAKDVDVEKIVRLIKERATFTADLWDLCFFFFEAPENYDEKASKNWKPDTTELLHKLIQLLENTATFQSEAIENAVKDWLTKDEIGMGKIMQPFRLSLVGALKGPHLFDIAALIGRKETIRRIENAIKHFSV
ncbi:MAG: glutamate--tRNA ligase family protein, partial [Flavobacteriaceae bacterium]|nr:glutamate--tRNA ligase family protein [Flavobacteriaceae bacterium]